MKNNYLDTQILFLIGAPSALSVHVLMHLSCFRKKEKKWHCNIALLSLEICLYIY